MPNKGAHADFLVNWERMLLNIARNAGTLPAHVQEYSAPLGELLNTVKDLGAVKESRRAVKQQGVKDHEGLIQQGRALAEKLIIVLKAHHGPTSELLLEYGINPRRPRRKKKAEEPKPETPAPAPEVKPASQTS